MGLSVGVDTADEMELGDISDPDTSSSSGWESFEEGIPYDRSLSQLVRPAMLRPPVPRRDGYPWRCYITPCEHTIDLRHSNSKILTQDEVEFLQSGLWRSAHEPEPLRIFYKLVIDHCQETHLSAMNLRWVDPWGPNVSFFLLLC